MRIRRPTLADADAVAALLLERDRVDFGETDGLSLTGAELRSWWSLDEPRLATDAWVALRGDDLVGYALARPERDLANLADESCVHPAARGLGVGTRLLDEAEHWARQLQLARFQVHVVNDDGRRLVEKRGHELVRFFWRMEIRLDEAQPELEPPAGMVIRAYRPGEDDAEVHTVVQQAFSEHWEFTPEPLDEWLKGRQGRNDYHPSLWRIAEEQGEIAGAALCFGEGGYGWVLELGVRPASRRGSVWPCFGRASRRSRRAVTRMSASRSTRRTRRARRGCTSRRACTSPAGTPHGRSGSGSGVTLPPRARSSAG